MLNSGRKMLKMISLDDIRRASLSDLKNIAQTIRSRIIEVVSKNGGHLASNLGVVELTLALYKVFDPRKDVVIWDTSHQSYTHKLVTGRWKEFDSLRKFGGVSGYTNRSESPTDWFGAGHVGTSIAAALGIERALKLENKRRNVVVILGDGALTNGEILESLNQIKEQNSKLKIILNDNGMAISSNVGALSKTLSSLRVSGVYTRLKEVVKGILEVSNTGKTIEEELKRMRDGFKNMLSGTDFFEALGLKHIGPLDGHDIETLVKILNGVKTYDHPCIVHVYTVKGKGYEPSEKDAVLFHSAPTFHMKTEQTVSSLDKVSYSEAFGDAMVKLAQKNEKIFAITAAMAEGTGLRDFSRIFPERFLDLGITEQSCVTYAAGLASMGFRPIVAIYSTFLQRAYDQIIHDVALQDLNVIFAVDRAGLVGEDGPTHHGVFDIAFFRSIPKSKIFAPSDIPELLSILKSVIDKVEGVVAIRYPKDSQFIDKSSLWRSSKLIDPFKWEILRKGEHTALLAVGSMVRESLLAAEGLNATVVYARCVKPLDTSLLKEISDNHDLIVTVEEGALSGGFGESVAAFLLHQGYKARVLNLGIGEEFVPHGSRRELLEFCKLDSASIKEAVISFSGRRLLNDTEARTW